MINRSLIRIKTIQILYSYLLTRSDFQLEAQPRESDFNRDRQFAYSVYLDFIFLLLKLSNISLGEKAGFPVSDPVLRRNMVGAMLYANPDVRNVIEENVDSLAKFDSCLADIRTEIEASPIYSEFKRKRKPGITEDVAFWCTIFNDIIRKNRSIERILRKSENFSHLGLENGTNMFIRALGTLDDSQTTLQAANEALDASLNQAYRLYEALLWLPVLITNRQKERIEVAYNKAKVMHTEADFAPDTALVDNLYVEALRNTAELKEEVDREESNGAMSIANPELWRDSDLLIDTLLDRILASELYAKYAQNAGVEFADDAAFWREAMRAIILPAEELSDVLESQSVYWNDDLHIMGTFVLKTIRRSYAPGEENIKKSNFVPGKIELLPKFMNRQDEEFGHLLFKYVVENRKQYRAYIDSFIDSKQWDSDRLAFMDIVLMMTAIAEIINFPSIPVPVTMNEYIEIANNYSTQRSGQFINGILFAIIKLLNQKGIISK